MIVTYFYLYFMLHKSVIMQRNRFTHNH